MIFLIKFIAIEIHLFFSYIIISNHYITFYLQVAVALMVVGLFFVIVAVEVLFKMVQELLSCDKEKKIDLEDQDPASLVGTFKRYK